MAIAIHALLDIWVCMPCNPFHCVVSAGTAGDVCWCWVLRGSCVGWSSVLGISTFDCGVFSLMCPVNMIHAGFLTFTLYSHQLSLNQLIEYSINEAIKKANERAL